MSLDVYLTVPGANIQRQGSGIFIREEGTTKEITREEWDRRNPGSTPVTFHGKEWSDKVFHGNITHNLARMAEAVGLYKPLWRPEEIGVERAEQLIPLLEEGLATLKECPDIAKGFNPSNGWGAYETLVAFVERYLAACREWPQAEVEVSR